MNSISSLLPISLQQANFASVATSSFSPKPSFITDKTYFSARQLQFAALPKYQGKFNHATLYSDFNDGASNHEALLRFNDVLYWTQQQKKLLRKNGFSKPLSIGSLFSAIGAWFASLFKSRQTTLDTKTFVDIPFGNIDYSGLTIQRLMMSRPNKDLLIRVTDPGVGNGDAHDRSILVTQHHGTFIGPNNGSLGVALQTLEKNNEHYLLYPIDLNKVEAFEKLRYGNPSYKLPESFHARDAFAVVGGALAGGIPPAAFADASRMKSYAGVKTEFSKHIQPLSLEVGKRTTCYACIDKTFGNIKTSITLRQHGAIDELKALIDAKAVFEIKNKDNGKSVMATAATAFSQVKVGEPLLYLGSTYANPPGIGTEDNSRFVELALNMGNISEKLGLKNPDIGANAVQLQITRVR